jgi:hypothetical protein
MALELDGAVPSGATHGLHAFDEHRRITASATRRIGRLLVALALVAPTAWTAIAMAAAGSGRIAAFLAGPDASRARGRS